MMLDLLTSGQFLAPAAVLAHGRPGCAVLFCSPATAVDHFGQPETVRSRVSPVAAPVEPEPLAVTLEALGCPDGARDLRTTPPEKLAILMELGPRVWVCVRVPRSLLVAIVDPTRVREVIDLATVHADGSCAGDVLARHAARCVPGGTA